MTHEEFMMLPYEQRCKLTICNNCIHQDICTSYMQINCECYIKGDPDNSVVLTERELLDSCELNYDKGYKQGSKETVEKCNSILEKNYKDWLKVLNDLKIDTSNKNILVSIVCGLFKNSQEEIAEQFGVDLGE